MTVYQIQNKEFALPTEYLSEREKEAHLKLLQGYIDALNSIAVELNAFDRTKANLLSSNDSTFRRLKNDEEFNRNAAYLHGLYFDNISDKASRIEVDSIAFGKLSRDFDSFDKWQLDFIACGLAARSGWVLTVYDIFLKRYRNCVVDLHNVNIPAGTIPVIALDVWEHSYFPDYFTDKAKYIKAMMVEFDWKVIETRFESTEHVHRIYNPTGEQRMRSGA